MVKYKNIISISLFTLILIYGCKDKSIDNLKINELQVLGTHNSYAKPIDPRILEYGDSILSGAMNGYLSSMPENERKVYTEYHPNRMSMKDGLNYNHPPFDVQLDAGLRSLEIDVYVDNEGNKFINPAGYRFFEEKGVKDLAPYSKEDLDKPGFKVLHVADFDVRTHYTTLEKALLSLKAWSDKNPNHIPLYIMIEAKDKGMPIFPNSATIEKFDEKAFDQLDAELVRILGRNKIITPDDVRGNYKTLREAVLAKNWPTLGESRGKFVFMLLPSAAGLKLGDPSYVASSPTLENRVMFVQSKPTDDYAAFLLLDNAIVRQEDIRKAVSEGFLVRTRADIETYEAKVNDYSRANAAFSSGAQVISTDFFMEGNTWNTDYRVTIPGGNVARINPINAPQGLDKLENIKWE